MSRWSFNLLERLYRRWGVGYFRFLVAGAMCVCALGFLLTVVALFRFTGKPVTVGLEMFGIGVACYTPLAALSIRRLWRDGRPLIDWIENGRPPEGADQAWRRSIVWISRALPRVYVLATLGAIPSLVYAVVRLHLSVAAVPVLWLAAQLGLGVTCVYLTFLGEAGMRPVIRDAAGAGSAALRPPRSPWQVRTKLVLALILTVAGTTFGAGAIVGVRHTGLGALLLAVAVVVGVTIVVGIPALLSVTDSVVVPVRLLAAGTERVAAGDLASTVPVITADELGVLASRFNVMLNGLRERERLREENVGLDAALRATIDELRASRARIVAASDAARRGVERDLHDGAQQHLVLLSLKLAMAQRLIEQDPVIASATIDDLAEDLQRALEELRELAHGIYPASLENDGLSVALSEASNRAAIPITLDCDSAGRYPPELEAAVYFCCLEALQNAAKHAGDARARVALAECDGALRFEVEDNGRGFDKSATNGSTGIQNMTDRIGALGGSLRVESAPGAGTRVIGTVPLSGPDRGALASHPIPSITAHPRSRK